MNLAILIGRVGSDPNVREFPNGDRVVSVNLATNKRWRDRTSGEFREKTDWHRVRVYGSPSAGPAETVARYVRKGSRIRVSGEISNIESIDQDGKRISKTYIEVRRMDGIELLDSRPRTEPYPAPAKAASGDPTSANPASTNTPSTNPALINPTSPGGGYGGAVGAEAAGAKAAGDGRDPASEGEAAIREAGIDDPFGYEPIEDIGPLDDGNLLDDDDFGGGWEPAKPTREEAKASMVAEFGHDGTIELPD